MNKKRLADRIVALGVGLRNPDEKDWFVYGIPSLFPATTAKHFVRDWRVAGALMEKVPTIELAQLVNSQGWAAQAANEDCLYTEVRNESAPRAIIEACVEALETNDE